MSLHKIRPRFKKYSKTKLFLKSDKQIGLTPTQKKNLQIFSPDVRYLNSR